MKKKIGSNKFKNNKQGGWNKEQRAPIGGGAKKITKLTSRGTFIRILRV